MTVRPIPIRCAASSTVSRSLWSPAAALGPLSMAAWPDIAGLLQRIMFGAAYAWLAAQALVTRE